MRCGGRSHIPPAGGIASRGREILSLTRLKIFVTTCVRRSDVVPADATVRRCLRNLCASAKKYPWATRGMQNRISPACGVSLLLQSFNMGLFSPGVRRFFRYTAVGSSTFALDLALLYFFTDVLGIYYLASAGISFLVAVSINYWLAREHVFPETTRALESGYFLFLTIAGTGLAAVVALMYLAVDVFGFGYMVSRVVIACFVGMWTYTMNLYVNFHVAGKVSAKK